jgi:hypothetical protein
LDKKNYTKRNHQKTGNILVTELLLQNAFFSTFGCFTSSKAAYQSEYE